MAGKRTLEFEILAETRKATKNLQGLKKELGAMDKKIAASKKNATGLSTSFSGLAKVAVGFIGIQKAIQGVTSAIGTMANFEGQIAKLGAISQASAEDLSQMEEEAKRLGATTQYTASQVAEAMNFLAMAGYDANQILGATEGVLQLATVGMMDLGEASDIASNVLSGFGLEAEETTRVVDVMSKTITTSNTNIQELGGAMSKVAPVAASMGMSIEETAAILGVYADAGIKAELAGTQLKMSLIQLGTDDKAAAQLEDLGIKAFDAKGNFKGMVNILTELKPALAKMTQEARIAAMVEIFGKRNIASANVAIDMLDSVKEKYKQNAESAGTAAEIAEKFMDTLGGAYKELNSALEAVILGFADELIPVMREALSGATDWLRSLTAEDIQGAAKSIATVAESIGAVIDGIRLLNDMAIPDFLTDDKEDYGFSDALMDGLKDMNIHVRALKGAFEEVFEMEDKLLDATAQYEDLSEQLKTVGESSKDLDSLTKAIEAQIIANGKNIQKWAVHERSTQKAKDAEKQLNDEITLLAKMLEEIQKKKDVHAGQIESAQEAEGAEKELSETTIKYSKETISTLKKEGEKRVKDNDKNLNDLKKSEAQILKDIEKLNAEHIKKLDKLNQERIDSLRDSQFDIADIGRSGLTEYQAYLSSQKEADEALAEARRLLAEEKWDDAEAFFDRYTSLVRDGAGTEIKEGEAVRLTKKQTSAEAIKDIQEEQRFIQEMYDAKKKAANEAQAEALKDKQAQLDSVRAQIEVQQQLTVVVKALVEALTGNTLEIDTKAGEEAITALKLRSEELGTELDNLENQSITPNVNSQPIKNAQNEVEKLKTLTINGVTLEVDANTKPADFGVDSLITTTSGKDISMDVNPELQTAQTLIDEFRNSQGITPATVTVEAKTDVAKTDTDTLKTSISSTPATITLKPNDEVTPKTHEIKSEVEGDKITMTMVLKDEATPEAEKVAENIEKVEPKMVLDLVITDAAQKIETVHKEAERPAEMVITANNSDVINKDAQNRAAIAQPSLHTIRANDSAVLAAKARARQPTFSQHTIYVRTVNRNAAGGPVENWAVQGLAEGGFSERVTGKVPGHDLSGSDDVPTLLTRGEFVQNVRAVDYYGPGFMSALNSLSIPRDKIVQKLATGGTVGKSQSTTSPQSLQPINLHIGGNNFELMADRDIADSLNRFFNMEEGL